MTARVAVLVLNWNGRRWLETCFAALRAQKDVSFEAWLVDNGSTDESIDLVRERFPEVRILAIGRNIGFGAAYNRAVAATDSPLVALLNNDAVVQADWLAALVDQLAADREIAVAGSKLLMLDQPHIVNHAGGRLTLAGAAYDVGFGQPDGSRFDRPGPTGCATGAALLMRSDAFAAVGGFDENYFAYFDDADLCWRFWLSGRSAYYVPAARALHAYGGSSGAGRLSAFRIRHCQTNRLQNMLKHLETGTLLQALPLSVAYDLLRTWQFLRARQPAGARAVWRGSIRAGRLLPSILNSRRAVQRTRVRSDAEMLRVGALVTWSEAAAEWGRLGGLGATGVS